MSNLPCRNKVFSKCCSFWLVIYYFEHNCPQDVKFLDIFHFSTVTPKFKLHLDYLLTVQRMQLVFKSLSHLGLSCFLSVCNTKWCLKTFCLLFFLITVSRAKENGYFCMHVTDLECLYCMGQQKPL